MTLSEIKKEVSFLNSLKAKYNSVNAKCKEELEKAGYALREVGTHAKDYTRSQSLSIRNGVLMFGVYNIAHRNYISYRAYCKRVS
jgi:hypothetical protein